MRQPGPAGAKPTVRLHAGPGATTAPEHASSPSANGPPPSIAAAPSRSGALPPLRTVKWRVPGPRPNSQPAGVTAAAGCVASAVSASGAGP